MPTCLLVLEGFYVFFEWIALTEDWCSSPEGVAIHRLPGRVTRHRHAVEFEMLFKKYGILLCRWKKNTKKHHGKQSKRSLWYNVSTQMTVVLVGKGIVSGDWPSRLEVIGAPGTYYNSIAFNHIFVLASRELSRWEAYMSPFSFTASHQQTLATSTAVKAASITPIVKFLPHHFLPLVRSPTTASNVASLWLRIRRVI